MKTLAYFLNKVSLEKNGNNWWFIISHLSPEIMQEIIDEACNRYTMQCCEAVKQRCADEAELVPEGHFNGFGGTIDTESILSIEIILP